MTGIQWTGEVWNPTTGCDKVSPGCGLPRFEGDAAGGCYAMAMAKRLKGMGQAKYQRDGDPRTSGPGFGVSVHPDALLVPLDWRKPRLIFVNSMSDLFHKEVPDDFIAQVFAVMAVTPHHTYQLLTKRHGRMRSLLGREKFADDVWGLAMQLDGGIAWRRRHWPLPNLWAGVSAEDQRWLEIRLRALRETPAAVRWISAEPLLGPLTFWPEDHAGHERDDCGEFGGWTWTCLDCSGPEAEEPRVPWRTYDRSEGIGIDWLVAGGESGPGARPCDLAWLRSLRDECAEANVPYFCKQLGAVLGKELGAGGKGQDMSAWPADLRVRQFPRVAEMTGAA